MKQYPTWVDLLAIVGVFVAASLVAGGISQLLQLTLDLPAAPGLALAYALSMGATIWMVWGLRRARTGGLRWPLSLRFEASWLPAMGWAVVMMAVLGVVLEPLLALFPAEWYEQLSRMIGRGGWAVAMSVVLAPVLEEWLFRGIIQPPAVSKWGAFRGILLSAAVFGVIHLMPMQVVNAFFIGLVFGYVFHKTGSLVPVILLHMLNNGVAMLQGDYDPTMVRDWVARENLYFVLYGVALTLLVLGGVMMARGLREKK